MTPSISNMKPDAKIKAALAAIKEKKAKGETYLTEMLTICAEKRTWNFYATQMGFKNAQGLDGMDPPAMETNLTCFFYERDVVFVGDDAISADAAIKRHGSELAGQDRENMEGSQRMILQRIGKGRVVIEQKDGVPYLCLWATHWNDWLLAIYRAGHGVDVYNLENL